MAIDRNFFVKINANIGNSAYFAPDPEEIPQRALAIENGAA
ncbi:hypothetical protein [Sphingomonas sp. PB4P5]